jgi:hypothetical protein
MASSLLRRDGVEDMLERCGEVLRGGISRVCSLSRLAFYLGMAYCAIFVRYTASYHTAPELPSGPREETWRANELERVSFFFVLILVVCASLVGLTLLR